MEKGIALGWLVNQAGTQSLVGETMQGQLRDALKSQVVRLGFRLGDHPTWTDDLIATHEVAINALIRNNQRVIAVLGNELVAHMGISDWNAPDDVHGQNAFRREFSAAAQLIAHRFPQILHWEIWNEPNVAQTHLAEERFARLLHDANAAVRRGNPDPKLHVITGGVFAHDINGPTKDRSAANYLDRVLQALGTDRPFTDIGQHYYLDAGGSITAQTLEAHLHAYLGFLQDVMTAHELGPDTKVVITEAGWATSTPGGVSPQQQADNLKTLFGFFRDRAVVDSVCWFTLADNLAAKPPLFFGLFSSNGQPKEAAVTEFLHAA